MQEFSSVSVSSYEAGTLADRLNEQAGDGWSVVAIVPTGSTVTAYLSRESGGASGSSASTSDTGSSSEPSPVENVSPAPAAATWGSDAAAESEPDTGIAISDNAGMGATPAAIEPVDEPGGWAVSPEPASSGQSSEPASASPTIPSYDSGSSASYGSGSTGSSQDTSGYGQSSYGQSSYDSGSSAASTGASTAASASAAPAGWYADPSSRYELRYWDGSQWTEHVSRAGQQFTDPPVA